MIRETLERLRAEDNLRELPRIESRGKYVVCDGQAIPEPVVERLSGTRLQRRRPEIHATAARRRGFSLSNPSSRLVTGNSSDYARLESALSELFGGRSALVAGSGYLVNAGVLPALTARAT